MTPEPLDRISLATIRAVKEVIEQGGFSAAARRLGMTQPAISQHVSKFETAAKTQLTKRVGNSFLIDNPAVAEFVNDIARAQAKLLQSLSRDARSGPKLGLCEEFAHTLMRHPDLKATTLDEYEIIICSPEQLNDMFRRGYVDLALRPLFPNEEAPIFSCPVGMAWAHPAGHHPAGTGQNLNVVMATERSPHRQYAEASLNSSQIDFRILCYADSPMVLEHMVRCGIASAMLPDFYFDEDCGYQELAVTPPIAVPYGLFHREAVVSYTKVEVLMQSFQKLLERRNPAWRLSRFISDNGIARDRA
jgi:DNA-binding transcriptional LysR family regulator